MVETRETWGHLDERQQERTAHAEVTHHLSVDGGAHGVRVSVVIACEIRAIADGLGSLLLADSRMAVRALGGLDTVFERPREHPDVVITDDGDNDDTLQKLRRIKAVWPKTHVLLLGVPARPQRLLECIQAGANAFATRDLSGRELVEAVVLASRGEMRVPPSLLEGIFAAFSTEGMGTNFKRAGVDMLTPREAEVFDLLNHGYNNREIANKLNLGRQTVKNYVHNVMSKMQARRRSEIVFFDQT